jgi:hypothetical protein
MDTTLVDTTDSAGFVLLTYTNPTVDSISYYLRGETWAKLGIPEDIKLGVDE